MSGSEWSARHVGEALAGVRARIEAAGGDPDAIVIVAVTKGFDEAAVDAAIAAGIRDIGENYAQELVAKAEGSVAASAGEAVRWHFIGRLQRNKVRSLASHVALWQSVDRPELGAEIARRAPGAEVLAQINVSGELTKGGCPPDAVAPLVRDLRADGLQVTGLMTVGANGPPEAARPGFARLRDLADGLSLPVRSMGMTGDLEVAVQEGATMVRVGTALFGPRSA